MSSDQKPGELFEGLEQYVRDLHQNQAQMQIYKRIAAENLVTVSDVAHQHNALMTLLMNRGVGRFEAHVMLEKLYQGNGYQGMSVFRTYLENLQDAEQRWAQGQKDPTDIRNRAERRRQARLNKRNKGAKRK